MPTYSLAEARTNLAELIDRAERGEEVVVSLEGRPVIVLKPVGQALVDPPGMGPSDWDWLRRRRVTPRGPGPDAVALVRQMRDED